MKIYKKVTNLFFFQQNLRNSKYFYIKILKIIQGKNRLIKAIYEAGGQDKPVPLTDIQLKYFLLFGVELKKEVKIL